MQSVSRDVYTEANGSVGVCPQCHIQDLIKGGGGGDQKIIVQNCYYCAHEKYFMSYTVLPIFVCYLYAFVNIGSYFECET